MRKTQKTVPFNATFHRGEKYLGGGYTIHVERGGKFVGQGTPARLVEVDGRFSTLEVSGWFCRFFTHDLQKVVA